MLKGGVFMLNFHLHCEPFKKSIISDSDCRPMGPFREQAPDPVSSSSTFCDIFDHVCSATSLRASGPRETVVLYM